MTRLKAPFGTRIDRTQPLSFVFEGQDFTGYVGDTIASALAGAGQWTLSRSFKYHRPRGGFSFAGTDANTLVQVGPEPNVAADLTQLEEGMQITAQNVNGSLARDRDAVLDHLSRFLPVGFYYRTFMGPTKQAWLKVWEPMIRAKAGLGVIPTDAPPQEVDKFTLHCDVAVVGAGKAGRAAAKASLAAGRAVILIDDQPHATAPEGATLLVGATCTGLFEDNWLAVVRGQTLIRIRASDVILATGRMDQIAVFRNNDLPGIISGGGAGRLIRDYGVAPGRRAVVLAADETAPEVLALLRQAGVQIAAIVEPTCTVGDAAAPVIPGLIEEAVGPGHVTKVIASGREISCDCVIVCGGSAPAWHLPCQAGARFSVDAAGQYIFTGLPENVRLAGSLASHADAEASGSAAAHGEDYDGAITPPPFALPLTPHPKGKDFVDLDEDLQVKDIQNAVKEGYRELELVKRFTTVGMGPSQGRHSALTTARLIAAATERELPQIGVTTARPPTAPEALGTLAGPHHRAERRTALHQVHVAQGAEMRPVGPWWRPYLYGTGDRTKLIEAEVCAVREGVGVLDVSTLGTLEVRGPDAGAFLDRIYTMAHAKQPVGRVRYCLMLNEQGTVIDDGVAYRIAEDRFYVTATTGAVARVYTDMTFWNAQWKMAVDVVNLTAAFSGFNITGPNARAVMEDLDSDIDFGRDAFPYLTGQSGIIAGTSVHAMRIGFTGELSYELHCPSSHAVSLWQAIVKAGAAHGLKPYGLEASRILRLEKGHILIGQDTDALTTPDELGMSWALSKKKPFYVGKRSVEMRRNLGQVRRLAALAFPPGEAPPGESCLVLKKGTPVGHVTSSVHSPTLGHAIALAYVPVQTAEGESVIVRDRDGTERVVPAVGHAFYDPANERQDL